MCEWNTSFSAKNDSNCTNVSGVDLHYPKNSKKFAQGLGTAKLRSYAKFRVWEWLICTDRISARSWYNFFVFCACLKHDPNNKHKKFWGTKSFFRVARVQIVTKTLKSEIFSIFCIFQSQKNSRVPAPQRYYVDLIEVCWNTISKIFVPICYGDTTTKFSPYSNAKFRITAKSHRTEPLRNFLKILWAVEINIWNVCAIWIIFGRKRGVWFTHVLSTVSYLKRRIQ